MSTIAVSKVGMSDEDRVRWDQRYRDGAYESRTHASALLVQWQERLPVGRALDLACGAGRNSLWLSARGHAVVAVDISGVALQRLRSAAQRAGMNIDTLAFDLDRGLPDLAGEFDLIIKMRYLNLALLPQLAGHLAQGGVLVCEVLLKTDDAGAGPTAPRFRAAPGELLAAARGLEVMYYDEGAVVDPDGRTVHLARFIGRRS
jgi:SAM-dependent methyltransferase